MFVVTKLFNPFHHPDLVEDHCRESLKNFGFNYIDLYLIHWPVTTNILWIPGMDSKGSCEDVDFVDTWRAMEKLVDKGLVKSIGLSNFNSKQI